MCVFLGRTVLTRQVNEVMYGWLILHTPIFVHTCLAAWVRNKRGHVLVLASQYNLNIKTLFF